MGMTLGVAARKRYSSVGFALGCGWKDPKAVVVAVAASSPRSGIEASSRIARMDPYGSTSTITPTVPA